MLPIIPVLKQSFHEWSTDKVPRLGAALSFYTIFSLAPLLIIAIGIAGIVFGRTDAEQKIIDELARLVGTENSDILRTMIERTQSAKRGTWAATLGIAALIFGAAGVFGQLKDALNTIFHVSPKRSGGIGQYIRDNFLSMSMVLGTGFLLLVSLVMSAILTAAGERFAELIPLSELLWQVLNFLMSFVITAILFSAIFKFLPDVRLRWREAWPGGVATALLFVLGQFLIGFYLGRSGVSSTYGAAGSLVIIMLWVNYSSQLVLFGAELTKVYATYRGYTFAPSTESSAPQQTKSWLQRVWAGITILPSLVLQVIRKAWRK